jgi:GABA permease
MWAFPYLTWVVLGGLVTIFVAMVVIPDQRQALLASVGSVVVALVAYEFRRRWGRTPPTDRVLAVPDRPDAEALRRDPGAD